MSEIEKALVELKSLMKFRTERLGYEEEFRGLGLTSRKNLCLHPSVKREKSGNVVDARCRYKAPVHYDDEVVVRTYLKNIRDKLIHFGYELVRVGSGELLAEGETTHIVADSQMKPRALPEKYMKVFREAIAKQ